MKLVSGQPIKVMTQAEKTWFESTRDDYLKQAHFTEATDLRDLDRLLVHELMVYRWTTWIAAGVDYEQHLIEEQELQRNIKLYSQQITDIKDSMGLSKKARDQASDKGTVADYVTDLKARAKTFGIHREHQLTKALALMEELSTVVGTFMRSDEEERKKLGFEDEEEILKWIIEVMLPEYREIDAHFRKNEQRYWVRDF